MLRDLLYRAYCHGKICIVKVSAASSSYIHVSKNCQDAARVHVKM